MDRREGDEDVSTILERARLDVKKLKARAETLKTDENGAVLLNRGNPDHVEWFEDDDSEK